MRLVFFIVFQKRHVPFDSLESLAVKRQRFTDQRLQQQPAVNGLLNNKGGHNTTVSLNPSFHTKTEFQRTSNHAGDLNDSPGSLSGFPLMHKLSSTSDTPVSKSSEKEPKVSLGHSPPKGDFSRQQLASSQHRKKKSKKHKEKEREKFKDNQGSDWVETSPDLKQNPDKLDSKAPFTIDWLSVVANYSCGGCRSRVLIVLYFFLYSRLLTHILSRWPSVSQPAGAFIQYYLITMSVFAPLR